MLHSFPLITPSQNSQATRDMDPEQSQGSDFPRNTDFCEECSVVVFDDGADEFYEGVNESNEPMLQSSREELGRDECLLDDHMRVWIDELPDLPRMAESSSAGCRMCGFVREALLRRNVACEGFVCIFGMYQWGGRAWIKAFLPSYGLAFWKCVVANFTTKTEVAVIDFDVETSNNDLRQWLGLGKKCAPEPLDPDNVEWLKSKLRSCDEECVHPKPASPFLPTRLIDVGHGEEHVPRLVVVKDILNMNSRTMDDLKYVALTYCWGPEEDAPKQVKTTKDTLSAHYKGMSLSYLSPIVRDTIKVCRALEIRYLWVDALCIIQGDKADFHRESQTMGKIYNSCAVAICPLSSQSCLQGYLGARPEGLDVDFQSSRHEHIRGTYRLVPHCTDVDRGELPIGVTDQSLHLDIERSSWYRRGWTFQELILSPRFVFLALQ
ncbi:hypothetical protein K456DRAFT_48554 [Colletotrichum gloeosporioides 23]|nr:hypothetical protein K456DRAFT_48554 [Colletotrichum gloeosporioides 23]